MKLKAFVLLVCACLLACDDYKGPKDSTVTWVDDEYYTTQTTETDCTPCAVQCRGWDMMICALKTPIGRCVLDPPICDSDMCATTCIQICGWKDSETGYCDPINPNP